MIELCIIRSNFLDRKLNVIINNLKSNSSLKENAKKEKEENNINGYK